MEGSDITWKGVEKLKFQGRETITNYSTEEKAF
jgi:hypothetical protein